LQLVFPVPLLSAKAIEVAVMNRKTIIPTCGKAIAWLAIVLVASAIESAAQTTYRQIIVSIPDRKLAVLENGYVIRKFDVAVGASISPTPTGEFVVVHRLSNPTYYHPGVVIPPGPDNPIGTRWLGLNRKGFGIHGTNAPTSIGKPASHGCIRLRNRDMEKLFAILRIGDRVEIRGERDSRLAQIFGSENNRLVAQAQTISTAAGGSQ
jgi:lipoprotein-anchoring transpeptidase ErfK/SrfK